MEGKDRMEWRELDPNPDCSRMHLYQTFLQSRSNDLMKAADELHAYLEKNFNNPPTREEVETYISDWKELWEKCKQHVRFFESVYGDWLEQPIDENCTARHKDTVACLIRRPLAELKKIWDTAQLLRARFLSPVRPAKCLQNSEDGALTSVTPLSSDEALSLIIDAGLSKHQYNLIRMALKSRGSDICPSYNHLVFTGKSRCYPCHITTLDTEVVVDLQSLIDHTSYRLMQTLPFTIRSGTLTVLYDWGLDGGISHSTYEQFFADRFPTANVPKVLCTYLVPVSILAQNGDALWTNPCASSTRYCRPIRMALEKETRETTEKERKRMKEEIEKLITKMYLFDGNIEITIRHRLSFCEVNSKVMNPIKNAKPTDICPVCGCTFADMDDVSNVGKVLDPEKRDELRFGISMSHARIHFMEFWVRLSHRLSLPDGLNQEGSSLSEEQEEILYRRKKLIRNKIKMEMGLTVKVPKSGFRTTQDDDTARSFFSKSHIAAKVLGVDEDLLKRFRNVLIAISVIDFLDADAFHNYCRDTVLMLDEKYHWCTITPTVHKILFHGRELVRCSQLPLGLLSEEAQEGRNYDFRNYRKSFARRRSRRDKLRDIFRRFILYSDPLIGHFSRRYEIKTLPSEVEALIDPTRRISLDESILLKYQESDDEEIYL